MFQSAVLTVDFEIFVHLTITVVIKTVTNLRFWAWGIAHPIIYPTTNRYTVPVCRAGVLD
jgi:hypothetical protein